MSGGLGKKACVIGAGGLGLAATKNLLEAGFDVTVFEKSEHIGGLWLARGEPETTSVLPETRAVLTKHACSYTDFPMSEDAERFPSASQVHQYLEDYARHFGLRKCIHLRTTVLKIARDQNDAHWLVEIQLIGSSQIELRTFDRLVIATGIHQKLVWPDIPGRDVFAGDFLHGLRLKDPSSYCGKRVLVIGLALTGADCIRHLVRAGTAQVYSSHRRQVFLVPQTVSGRPMAPPLRTKLSDGWTATLAPQYVRQKSHQRMQTLSDCTYSTIKDLPIMDRKQRKAVHVESRIPVYADDLVPLLATGRVQSVQAVDKVLGTRSIRLVDGTVLENIDAIICATGATTDASSLLPTFCDPAAENVAPIGCPAIPEHIWSRRPVLRLYQNWLSPKYPHSLAILGYAVRIQGSFPLADVISMAMTQLWSARYPMPTVSEMNNNIDSHYRYVVSLLKTGDVMFPGRVSGLTWEKWHDRVIGSGIHEHLANSWSWKSWKLWWNDRELYDELMDSPEVPYMWRLFDTGRDRAKYWPGARRAIFLANKAEAKLVSEWTLRQESEKSGK